MYPLADDVFAPRNQWYVAAWSREVTRTPMERWILDAPVAMYRTEAGEAVAIGGRCPHRHFPLGRSRLVGDTIECGYHGFRFDRSGQCVKIPSQTSIPAACRVPAYPLVERWDWLWIWPGDPAKADPALIPDHRELGLEGDEFASTGGVYYEVPGNYALMHDNLLDLSHLGYLHQTTIASGGIAEAQEIRDEGPGWLRSTRRMANVECPPIFAQFLGHSGNVDRAFGMKWFLPSVHAGFDHFHEVAADPCSGRFLGGIRVFHAITPGRLRDAHYFFGMARSFAKDDPSIGDAFINGLRVTLDEDMSATRYIQQMMDSLPSKPQELLIRGDAHAARGRRLLEATIRAESVSP